MPFLIIAIVLILISKSGAASMSRGSVETKDNGNNLPASDVALAVLDNGPITGGTYVSLPKQQPKANDLQQVAQTVQQVKQAVQVVETVKDVASKAADVLVKATPAAVVPSVAAQVPAAAAAVESPAAAAGAAAAPASSPALGIVAQAVPVLGAMGAIYAGTLALANAWVGPGASEKTVEQSIQEDLNLRNTIGEAAYQKLQPSTAPTDVYNPNIAINKTAGKPASK